MIRQEEIYSNKSSIKNIRRWISKPKRIVGTLLILAAIFLIYNGLTRPRNTMKITYKGKVTEISEANGIKKLKDLQDMGYQGIIPYYNTALKDRNKRRRIVLLYNLTGVGCLIIGVILIFGQNFKRKQYPKSN